MEKSQLLIEVNRVSKKFCKDLKLSLIYGLKDVVANFFGIPVNHEKTRKGEFWALEDISFELRKGEVLGILGRNGSGKTTLMRLLNGMYIPSNGTIKINGSISSIFAVTAGLENVYTGRENIFLKGSMMGYNEAEIGEKLEEIIDFSELKDSIDAPFGTYSSGMKARLGLSIAYSFKPDILIIDEGLAVGDLPFKLKSIQKVNEISKECAVIVISHNMHHITRLATKIIVLDKGKMVFRDDNSIEQGIDFYYKICSETVKYENAELTSSSKKNPDEMGLDLIEIQKKSGLGVSDQNSLPTISYQAPLVFNIEVSNIDFSQYYLRLNFIDEFDNLESFVDQLGQKKLQKLYNESGKYSFELRIPELAIKDGLYKLSFEIVELRSHNTVKVFEDVLKLQVNVNPDVIPRQKLFGKWNINTENEV